MNFASAILPQNYNFNIMTKEGFLQLHEDYLSSGLGLMAYLRKNRISYSNYNYWRQKYLTESPDENPIPLAPVRILTSSFQSTGFPNGEITVKYPNGVTVILGAGMEESALRMITSYTDCHVLP